MPWRETGPMNERMSFVVEHGQGQLSVAALCRAYGISRKTGYKWLARYGTAGAGGLSDQSRAPHSHPQSVSAELAEVLRQARAGHPTWGPRKLIARLRAEQPGLRLPAASTVGAVLTRAGLTVHRRRRHHTPLDRSPLRPYAAANAVWCADFKGHFLTADGAVCYPLTISDGYSRYLLRCQAVPTPGGLHAQPIFDAAFREFGLPTAIRTDNGAPFASTGLAGLSRLSVWWIKLGIAPERIEPGKPTQNGRHERMHRTLKQETATPPKATLRAQQRAFDAFRHEYNQERPHEALGQVPPAMVFGPSTRPYRGRPAELVYPDADAVRQVHHQGEVRWHGHAFFLTEALAGEVVGLQGQGAGRWQVVFGPLVLGMLDEEQGKMVPLQHGGRDSAGGSKAQDL
jgi:putative transposase